jgi:hemolysin type calcium-binding protein
MGRRRSHLVIAVLASALAIHVGTAVAHHRCLGYRATIVGSSTGLKSHGRQVIGGTHGRDVIAGTKSGEWIIGNGGRDVICGGGGRDMIMAGLGRHDRGVRIDGGRGNDYVDGGTARDRISGGSGNDQINGEAGDDLIDGGPGRDTIRSSIGNDHLRSGPGDDLVMASSGRDAVWGGKGDDTISTGPAADVVYGGPGNDLLNLLEGADRGYGGIGDDQVGGFNGNDHIYGGLGNDRGNGGYGNDIHGGFETWFDFKGSGVPLVGAPIPHLRRAGTKHAIHHLARYARLLERRTTVNSDRAVAMMYARRGQLADAAHRLIRKRFKHRVRHMHRARASLLRSEESRRVRVLLRAVSDQIDRLVIARAGRA